MTDTLCCNGWDLAAATEIQGCTRSMSESALASQNQSINFLEIWELLQIRKKIKKTKQERTAGIKIITMKKSGDTFLDSHFRSFRKTSGLITSFAYVSSLGCFFYQQYWELRALDLTDKVLVLVDLALQYVQIKKLKWINRIVTVLRKRVGKINIFKCFAW